MNVYAVRVFEQGIRRGRSIYVEAQSAREAIDEIEARLGLKPPSVSVDEDTGKMVADWHGYEFKARRMQ